MVLKDWSKFSAAARGAGGGGFWAEESKWLRNIWMFCWDKG